MDTATKTETVDTEKATRFEMPEPEGYPFGKDSVPTAMSGAEVLAQLEKSGAFEVWAEQYKDIGPGKKYADSTEYVQAMRARAE